MTSLTSLEADQLGTYFSSLAQDLQDFLMAQFSNLTPEQKTTLDRLQKQLLDLSDAAFTSDAINSIQNKQDALDTLNNVTQQINVINKRLQGIQSLIDIAAGVLSLASALVAKDPTAARQAISGIANTLKQSDQQG